MKKQNVTHGTIYLMAAQAAFVASGYAIHIGLARLLGPSDYGIYAVVISLMTMVNLILTTGIPQAVSKYVAHDDDGMKCIAIWSGWFSKSWLCDRLLDKNRGGVFA